MTDDEKKEFEEFLEWKKDKSNQTDEKSGSEKSDGRNDNIPQVKSSHSGMGKGLGCGCLGVIAFILLLALFSQSGHNQGDSDSVDWSEASVM